MGFPKPQPKPVDPGKKYTRPDAYSTKHPRLQEEFKPVVNQERVNKIIEKSFKDTREKVRGSAKPAPAPLGGQRRIKFPRSKS